MYMKKQEDKVTWKNIKNRMMEPTPLFWIKVRNIAVTSVGISGAIIAVSVGAPVAIPAGIITAAKYVVLIGSVMGIQAQATVK